MSSRSFDAAGQWPHLRSPGLGFHLSALHSAHFLPFSLRGGPQFEPEKPV